MTIRKPTPSQPLIVPPETRAAMNHAIAEHTAQAQRRQSDHEIKVDGTVAGVIAYTKRREETDRDLATGLAILARHCGALAVMPERIRALAPTPPKAEQTLGSDVRKGAEDARKSARASYLAAAVFVLDIAAQLLRHFYP